MGEITGGASSGWESPGSPTALAKTDHAITGELGKVKTDVPDVFADGEKHGMPVFNVDRESFYQNMTHGRKRLRLKSGTSGQLYMQKTQYQRPFWLSYKDPNSGEVWTRKVK